MLVLIMGHCSLKKEKKIQPNQQHNKTNTKQKQTNKNPKAKNVSEFEKLHAIFKCAGLTVGLARCKVCQTAVIAAEPLGIAVGPSQPAGFSVHPLGL